MGNLTLAFTIIPNFFSVYLIDNIILNTDYY